MQAEFLEDLHLIIMKNGSVLISVGTSLSFDSRIRRTVSKRELMIKIVVFLLRNCD